MRVSSLTSPAFHNHLSQLMELYERNYAQLRLLAPALTSLDGLEHISHVAGCLPLFLRIVERGRYTTTVNLSYQFDDNHSAPDMTIRIYHDARVAECMSGLIHGRRHEQRRTRALDDSWRLNRFLYKWLRYCRHRGHRF